MTTSNLATCFGPTVFRTEQESVSNLYNIKFYSEIIELLIVHHEKIFQPSLDPAFLNSLMPLKTPPTMMSSVLATTAPNNLSSNSNSSLSPSAVLTPLPPYSRFRSANVMALSNRRGLNYEPELVSAPIGSSKTSVSSDSSQSDREQQLNNLSQLTLSQPIASPISSSSPGQYHALQNHLARSLASPHSATLNKHHKPYNSQTGQFYPREPSSANTPASRASTHSLTSASSAPSQYLTGGKVNVTSSPLNSRSTAAFGASSSAAATSSISSIGSNVALSNSVNISDLANKARRARTLYPCEADNPSELSFEANVIISNVRRSKEAGWLEASYNGKSGLVPGNYIQILDD